MIEQSPGVIRQVVRIKIYLPCRTLEIPAKDGVNKFVLIAKICIDHGLVASSRLGNTINTCARYPESRELLGRRCEKSIPCASRVTCHKP
jgi:hypothetical protein